MAERRRASRIGCGCRWCPGGCLARRTGRGSRSLGGAFLHRTLAFYRGRGPWAREKVHRGCSGMLGRLAPRAVERAGRKYPREGFHDAVLLLSSRQSRVFLLRRKMLMGGFGCEEVFTMTWFVVGRPDHYFHAEQRRGSLWKDDGTL